MAGKALVASCWCQLGKVVRRALQRYYNRIHVRLHNAKDLSMQCDDSELFCVPSLIETGVCSEVSDLVTVWSAEQCVEEAIKASSRLRTQPQADLQPEVQSADDTELSADLATGNSSNTGVVSPQNTSYSSFCSSPEVDAFVSCLSLLEDC